MGLNCSPATAPWCCNIVARRHSESPAASFTGSQSLMCPSDMPDAIKPSGWLAVWADILDHEIEENRALLEGFKNKKINIPLSIRCKSQGEKLLLGFSFS